MDEIFSFSPLIPLHNTSPHSYVKEFGWLYFQHVVFDRVTFGMFRSHEAAVLNASLSSLSEEIAHMKEQNQTFVLNQQVIYQECIAKIKEHVEEMEPVIRNCHLVSFDMSALAHAYAPANAISPNGLTGEEACILMQYAGMSPNMKTIGIFGYLPEQDKGALTAKQISQMLWYMLDGKSRGNREAKLEEKH